MRRALAAVLGVCALLVSESRADACGGCFHPEGETPTVVTDHRMIFSVSQTQATLYDQIQYQGNPSSFAWVLPYAGDITVGVSSDALFQVLDQQTATQLNPPPQNCPSLPSDCFEDDDDYSAGSVLPPSSNAKRDQGVEVLKREVVGPYETVQLKATDPNALADWLAKNKFAIPPDVQPIIAQYLGEHFNFLAVKLVPGAGTQSMRPIRVTTKGASVALPLRMVAAGTGATVGITLWIVGDGRYQPQSFPTFHIEDPELLWDWDANKSNYTDLRAQKTAAGNNAIWEIESSTVTSQSTLQGRLGFFPDPNHGYTVEGQDDVGVVETRDLDTLFNGINPSTARVTRLRADLAHAALNRDFVVEAAPDQVVLPNIRQVTKESVEPMCPVYDDCGQVGTARRSEAIRKNKDNEGCATTRYKRSGWLELSLAGVGLAMIRRRRKR